MSYAVVSLILLLFKISFQRNQLIKGETKKHIFSNYKPASILNTFSEIIEWKIFDQITICPNEFVSVFMETYCKHYGTHHVFLHLLKEWRANLDQNKIIGAVL